SIHFCFQAEDGIRDFHVTGVQTCALPIWEDQVGVRGGERYVARLVRKKVDAALRAAGRPDPEALAPVALEQPSDGVLEGLTWRRSEERRVGKECRSRGSWQDDKEIKEEGT